VQARGSGGGGPGAARPSPSGRGNGTGGASAARPGRPHRGIAGLARRRRDRRAVRWLPRTDLSHARGLRDHPARGHGGRTASHRPGPGRRARDGGGPRRRGAPHWPLLRAPDRGGTRGGDPALRVRPVPVRAQGAAPPRRGLRPWSVQGAGAGLPDGQAPGAPRVLKAYSRLLEQLMLARPLLLVPPCWLLPYGFPFYVIVPPIPGGVVPPLGPYLLILLPILLGGG